jgi:cobalt-zinc-cadmium efflux system membrane fusion protein
MKIDHARTTRMSLPLIAVLAVCAVFATGCSKDRGEVASAIAASSPDARGHAEDHPGHLPEGAESHGESHGDSHGEEAEVSDLDRPVDDLMKERCEHDIPMHECDECRYEIGVVKVAPDLLDEDGPLQTARVVRRTTEASVAHNGEVRLNEEHAAYLSPRTAGTVRSILVDLGARIRRGQLLFTVDSPEFAEARSGHLIAQASLKLAEGTLGRERDLYEKKVCPRKDLLEAEAARDAAAATAQAARERLLACGLTAEEIAGLSTGGAPSPGLPVRAPFDGTVLERNLSMGSLVEPGQKLLLLGDTSEMWVWTSVYERELAGLLQEEGKGTVLAHVEVPAYPGRQFPGRVDRMTGVVDEATRTAKVRVIVSNPEGLLRAGMFARVHLLGSGSEQTLTVPAEAVLEDEGRAFVFVPAEPPYFIRRPVMTGRSWGEWTEVTQGLTEGDIVVSRGAFALKSDVLRSKMGAGCAD